GVRRGHHVRLHELRQHLLPQLQRRHVLLHRGLHAGELRRRHGLRLHQGRLVQRRLGVRRPHRIELPPRRDKHADTLLARTLIRSPSGGRPPCLRSASSTSASTSLATPSARCATPSPSPRASSPWASPPSG